MAIPKRFKKFTNEYPEVADAYQKLGQAVHQAGPLDEKTCRLVKLAIARSRLTGMTPDRVAASIASFDFLYLSALNDRRVVAPSVRSSDARVSSVTQSGGHVLEPVTGRHRNVWVFDFKSLYPSIIRTLNIDPLGYRQQNPEGADLIETVSGAEFAREAAILPGMLDALFPRREAARQSGVAVVSEITNAAKINQSGKRRLIIAPSKCSSSYKMNKLSR